MTRTPQRTSSARRRLLQASLALIPMTAAFAADKRLDESDPQAKALGYTLDASKVDKAKFKTYQAGQHCASCQFFQGTAGQEWGPCIVFHGKDVHAKGWCSAWAKKA